MNRNSFHHNCGNIAENGWRNEKEPGLSMKVHRTGIPLTRLRKMPNSALQLLQCEVEFAKAILSALITERVGRWRLEETVKALPQITFITVTCGASWCQCRRFVDCRGRHWRARLRHCCRCLKKLAKLFRRRQSAAGRNRMCHSITPVAQPRTP